MSTVSRSVAATGSLSAISDALCRHLLLSFYPPPIATLPQTTPQLVVLVSCLLVYVSFQMCPTWLSLSFQMNPIWFSVSFQMCSIWFSVSFQMCPTWFSVSFQMCPTHRFAEKLCFLAELCLSLFSV